MKTSKKLQFGILSSALCISLLGCHSGGGSAPGAVATAASSSSHTATMEQELSVRSDEPQAQSQESALMLGATAFSVEKDMQQYLVQTTNGTASSFLLKSDPYCANRMSTAKKVTDVQIAAWNPTIDNSLYTVSGDMKQLPSDPTYAGDSYLTNSSNYNQTLTSSAFSLSNDDSTSSSTTETWSAGSSTTGSFEVNVKFGKAGGEQTITIGYSRSTTETTTKSTSRTYTAPGQAILIPPQSMAVISAVLNKVKVTGTYRFFNVYGGNASLKYKMYCADGGSANLLMTKPIPLMMSLQSAAGFPLPDGMALTLDNKGLEVGGKGKYQADFGTDFLVTVTIKPLNQNGSLLKNNAIETYQLVVPATVSD